MHVVGIKPQQRDELFNRLINAKAEETAVEMDATTLARNPEPKGSRIVFRHGGNGDIHGCLGQVYESTNGDVVIEINGEFRVLAGDATVKIWPAAGVETQEVDECSQFVGNHMAYGPLYCDQPKGHGSAHEQSVLPEQCDKARNGIRCAFNKGHDGMTTGGHNFSKQLNKLRGQYPVSEWTEYQAEFMWMNRDMFLGRKVRLPEIGAAAADEGEVTDIWHITTPIETRVFLVFNGRIHSVPKHSKVKVAPKKAPRCTIMWTGDGNTSQCKLDAYHSGSHTY
jgi:hypothetical protein